LLTLRKFIYNPIANSKSVESIGEEKWSVNPEILKMLDILIFYPNEFAQYPINTFYLIHHKEPSFEHDFEIFLKRLARDLILRFVLQPSVNAVKSMVVKTNVAIVGSSKPSFEEFIFDEEYVKTLLTIPHIKVIRMLLLMLAYEEQKELLPWPWEIEHIIPQKWHANYFDDLPEEEIKQKIEHIGNKVPFEKPLNIRAGNGYFTKKQKEYKGSQIVITRRLGEIPCDDWHITEIENRDAIIIPQLMAIFARWKDEYEKTEEEPKDPQLSKEEAALLEKIKSNKTLYEQFKGML
ncbi:MAG: HNH endonuclease family protein, partial [Bacteroidaceae bacterium]|nr:HNH endonuclease family protein [Bacteroidaceae bacterium]